MFHLLSNLHMWMCVCVQENKFDEYSNDNYHCDVIWIFQITQSISIVSFCRKFAKRFAAELRHTKKRSRVVFALLRKNTSLSNEIQAMQVHETLELTENTAVTHAVTQPIFKQHCVKIISQHQRWSCATLSAFVCLPDIHTHTHTMCLSLYTFNRAVSLKWLCFSIFNNVLNAACKNFYLTFNFEAFDVPY